MKVKLIKTIVYSPSYQGLLTIEDYKTSKWEHRDKQSFRSDEKAFIYLKKGSIATSEDGELFLSNGRETSLDPSWYAEIRPTTMKKDNSTAKLTEALEKLTGKKVKLKEMTSNPVDMYLDNYIADDLDLDNIKSKKDLEQQIIDQVLANIEEYNVSSLEQLTLEQKLKLQSIINDEWAVVEKSLRN